MKIRRHAPFSRVRCCVKSVDQQANSSGQQTQFANQLNYNKQIGVVAIADSGSTAIALQKAYQLNKNLQDADLCSSNRIKIDSGSHKHYHSDRCCTDIEQGASAIIGQNQHVVQDNVNIQKKAIKVGSCSGQKEKIVQCSRHLNKNAQDAFAKAVNYENTKGKNDSHWRSTPEKEVGKNDIFKPDVRSMPERQEGTDIKLMLSMKQGGKEMIIETDGKGNTRYDERRVNEPQNLLNSEGQDNCCINIALVLEGQLYEITADENDNVFINGHQEKL